MTMMKKLLNYIIVFLTLNKEAWMNAKALMNEAMDIGMAVSKMAKTKVVDQKAKDALAMEVKEFNEAVNKFLDDLVIPD